MSRKFSLFIVAFLLVGCITSFGQTAPVNGTVELKKADGTKEPVANALIEVYRIDIKSGFPSAKTNKKGEFSFAGIPFGGTYAFALSAPGCSPLIFPGVRAGQEKLVITLTPGDGRKLTEEDVRKGAVAKGPAANGPAEPSAEDKKAQAEFEKKNAEITDKNKKIQAADETAKKSNEEGNAALKAENFDLAITKFSEGVEAVPDYVGSTPVLLSGKMMALKAKGFKFYKEGATQPDLEVRKAKYAEANKNYDDALVAFQNAVNVIKKAEAAADPADQKRRDELQSALYTAATEIHRLKAVSGVDTTKAADADKVVTAYIAMETDPVKKLAAQMTLGDIMRLTENRENAIAAYKKVLEASPNNLDALAYLGLVLVDLGWIKDNDKALSQEGANYLQKFVSLAPDTHTLKVGAVEYIKILQTQNVVPVKQTPGKKKP